MITKIFHKALTITALSSVLFAAACSPIETNHGYLPVSADVEALASGADSKQTVLESFGEPTSRGLEGDSSWYYISYTVRKLAFLAPKITDREILAISFGANGRVSAVNRYGLEHGQVINLNSRETVTGGRELTFFEQMLGNIGNFSAESFL